MEQDGVTITVSGSAKSGKSAALRFISSQVICQYHPEFIVKELKEITDTDVSLPEQLRLLLEKIPIEKTTPLGTRVSYLSYTQITNLMEIIHNTIIGWDS